MVVLKYVFLILKLQKHITSLKCRLQKKYNFITQG